MTSKDYDDYYPTWICIECGTLYGRTGGKFYCATFHPGHCGVCGREASVTEPRDFGHLREDKDWINIIKRREAYDRK